MKNSFYTRFFCTIVCIFVLVGGVHASGRDSRVTSSQDTSLYRKDRVIVKFQEDAHPTKTSLSSNVPNLSLSEFEYFDTFHMGILHIEKEATGEIEQYVQDLNKMPSVEYAEFDYKLDTLYTGVETNDTLSIDQWYLKSIQADDAWSMYGDLEDKITVSVNDSGIDYTHDDIISNLKDLSETCFSDTGALIPGGCPYSGWNFEGNGAYNSFTALLPENDPYDLSGHGTHVAGTIGSVGYNGTGTIGVTQNVEMIAARLDTYDYFLYGDFYISNTIRGLNFAMNNGAKVINMSYGGSAYSQASYDALEVARDNGVLLVIAAGNNGTDNDSSPFYPASYDLDNIISVASIGPDDTLASYSNYGAKNVDIAAPGGDIVDYDTGEGGILAPYPFKEEVFSHDLSSFAGTTITGTGSDWHLGNSSYGGYYTQTPLYYTGGIDTSLIFDSTFSLAGAEFATLNIYIDCDFGVGNYDDDFGDFIEFSIVDINTSNEYWIDKGDWDGFGGGFVTLPIVDEGFYADTLQLKTRFVTDSDSDIGKGCYIDDVSVISHDKDKHSYKSIEGTSMAAPVVSGVAAMVWSYYPEMSYSDVEDILLTSVDNLNLQSQIKTGGKVNANNAIQEVIRRYGLTKSGTLSTSIIQTPKIDLTNKNVSLSGTTIDITGTGEVVKLSNNSTLSGSGHIQVGTGVSLYNDTTNTLSTSDDFEILLKRKNGELITSSNSGVVGEGIYLFYTGTLVGTGVKVDIGDIFDGELIQDTFIPLSSDFSGSLDYSVYKTGSGAEGFSSDIVLDVYSGSTLFDFTYAEYVFTGSLDFASGGLTNSTGTTLHLFASEYPVSYELSGSLAQVYTGTLNNSESIEVELTSGDGEKHISGILKNIYDEYSSLFSGGITLDQTSPTASLQANTSTGVSVQSIDFTLSTQENDFDSGSIVWSNNINAQTGTGFTYRVDSGTSNNLIVTVQFKDLAGNTGSAFSETYVLDNTAPDAPVNVLLNGGNIINVSNVGNVVLSGSGNVSESGAIVSYIVSDTATGSISGTGTLVGESFQIDSLDLSNFSDGSLNYSVYVTDIAGNNSVSTTGSVIKETQAPTGSIMVGNPIINMTNTSVHISSSEYPVSYELSGSLVQTYTGTLNNSGSIEVELTSGDGEKQFSVQYKDVGANYSPVYTGTVVLDQTGPSIVVTSHSNNDTISGQNITLTGTVTDLNGIQGVMVGGENATISSGAFTQSLVLDAGENTIAYSATDIAGNVSMGSIDIVRLPQVLSQRPKLISTTSVAIDFETDITSTGEILYSTGLFLDANGVGTSFDTKHHIILENLEEATKYFYRVRGYNSSYTGALYQTGSFLTPKGLSIETLTGTIVNTGAIQFTGTGLTASGIVFDGTGVLDIHDDEGKHKVTIHIENGEIESSSWDGVFHPPEQVGFSGSFTNTRFTHIEDLTYNIGSSDAELTLSGASADVEIEVGTSYNGRNLGVFRSTDSGVSYDYLSSCVVSDGVCSFSTNKFSLFTIGDPSDSTPDSFNFVNITNAEINTEYISDSITVSGINTGSTISVTGGSYSINNGSYTADTGIVYNNDTVKLKLTSSSSYSTAAQVEVSIGGVSDTYSVTTKVGSSGGSGGGGGGGGGGSYLKTCKAEQLVCQLVPGSSTTYKFYKKSGVSCAGGDVGNVCSLPVDILSISKKYPPIASIFPQVVIQDEMLNTLYTLRSKQLKKTDAVFDTITYLGDDIAVLQNNYRHAYQDWIDTIMSLDKSIGEQNEEAKEKYSQLFQSQYQILLNSLRSFHIVETKIGNRSIVYMEYDDEKITKLQDMFHDKLALKEENEEAYKLIHGVIHKIYFVLKNQDLSSSQRKEVMGSALLDYNAYKKIYKNLAIKKEEKQNIVNEVVLQSSLSSDNKSAIKEHFINRSEGEKKTQYSISSYSVKLYGDSGFQYLVAWVKAGDRVELIERTGNILKIKIIESYDDNNIGKEGYIYRNHLREIK